MYKLNIGDIVEVINEQNIHYGEIGKVVLKHHGEYAVQITDEMRDLYGYGENDTTDWFSEYELKRREDLEKEFKIGDKVEIVDEQNIYYGEIGTVVRSNTVGDYYVKFDPEMQELYGYRNEDMHDWYQAYDLQRREDLEGKEVDQYAETMATIQEMKRKLDKLQEKVSHLQKNRNKKKHLWASVGVRFDVTDEDIEEIKEDPYHVGRVVQKWVNYR